jgi:hypothetical protein
MLMEIHMGPILKDADLEMIVLESFLISDHFKQFVEKIPFPESQYEN